MRARIAATSSRPGMSTGKHCSPSRLATSSSAAVICGSARSQPGGFMKAKTGVTGTFDCATSSKRGAGRGSVARSAGSYPASTSVTSAQSSTERAKTPNVSRNGDCIRTPVRGIRPKLGFNPTTPQKDAGRMMDPPVWVPTASGTMPAATAAADPCDDPPGVWAGLWGLRVLLGCR